MENKKLDSGFSFWERCLYEACRDIFDDEISVRKTRILNLKKYLEREIKEREIKNVEKFLDEFLKENFNPEYSPIPIYYPKNNERGYCLTITVMYLALAEMLDFDLFLKLDLIDVTDHYSYHITVLKNKNGKVVYHNGDNISYENYKKLIEEVGGYLRIKEKSQIISDIYIHKGSYFYSNGNYKKSLECFLKSLKIDPQNVLAYINFYSAILSQKLYQNLGTVHLYTTNNKSSLEKDKSTYVRF